MGGRLFLSVLMGRLPFKVTSVSRPIRPLLFRRPNITSLLYHSLTYKIAMSMIVAFLLSFSSPPLPLWKFVVSPAIPLSVSSCQLKKWKATGARGIAISKTATMGTCCLVSAASLTHCSPFLSLIVSLPHHTLYSLSGFVTNPDYIRVLIFREEERLGLVEE